MTVIFSRELHSILHEDEFYVHSDISLYCSILKVYVWGPPSSLQKDFTRSRCNKGAALTVALTLWYSCAGDDNHGRDVNVDR